jgi:ribosome-binding protein aMBF1 (putative translation factor)
MASTGILVQAQREALGLSRAELAKKLKTTYLQVYRIETGVVRLQPKSVPAWSRTLKLDESLLLRSLAA